MSEGPKTKLGTAAREYWDVAKRKMEAHVAYARGDISAEQLAEIVGPPPPPGTSFADVVKTIRQAPEGTFAGMLRRSAQELLTAATKRSAKRDDDKSR